MKYKLTFKGLDATRDQFIRRTEEFFKKLYPLAKVEVTGENTSRLVKVKAWMGEYMKIYLCIMDEMSVIKLEQTSRDSVQVTAEFTMEELEYFDKHDFELDYVYKTNPKQNITDWFGAKK